MVILKLIMDKGWTTTTLCSAMDAKKNKFTIESELKNVPLIGMSISRLCSMINLSDIETYWIELCAVEAVTNSIKHAYGLESGHEVEVIFTIDKNTLTLEICDTGTALNPRLLEEKAEFPLKLNVRDVEDIPESGRGLAIIREFMDDVKYASVKGRNCLTMIKRLSL